MAKMTHGVEIELQRHMENLELRVQTAADAIQGLGPEFDRLRAKLTAIDKYITSDLDSSVKHTSDTINHGIQDATQLQRLLAAMIQTMLDSNSQAVIHQDNAVALAEQRDADLSTWAAVMKSATSSALSLNSRIVRIYLSTAAPYQPSPSLNPFLTPMTDLMIVLGAISARNGSILYAPTCTFHKPRPTGRDYRNTLLKVRRPCPCDHRSKEHDERDPRDA